MQRGNARDHRGQRLNTLRQTSQIIVTEQLQALSLALFPSLPKSLERAVAFKLQVDHSSTAVNLNLARLHPFHMDQTISQQIRCWLSSPQSSSLVGPDQ